MPDKGKSCVEPAAGPISAPESTASNDIVPSEKEIPLMTAQVGKPAPDFEANAYVDGAFAPIKLSDYLGHWLTLCFYPGDFTFV